MYSLTPILKLLFTCCSCILCGRLTHMLTLRHKNTDHTYTYFFFQPLTPLQMDQSVCRSLGLLNKQNQIKIEKNKMESAMKQTGPQQNMTENHRARVPPPPLFTFSVHTRLRFLFVLSHV